MGSAASADDGLLMMAALLVGSVPAIRKGETTEEQEIHDETRSI